MQVHEAGGQGKDGQACLGWRPIWPLNEDMRQHLHAGMLVAEGPLALCPCSLRQHWLSLPWQGLALLPPPCPWESQSAPRILSPRPSDCLVLQLFLPCVPGDLLAAFSWEPRPQTHPHSRLRPPSPTNVLLLPWQPALCTCLPPAQPHWPLSAFPLSPSQGFLSTACCAVSACP